MAVRKKGGKGTVGSAWRKSGAESFSAERVFDSVQADSGGEKKSKFRRAPLKFATRGRSAGYAPPVSATFLLSFFEEIP